MVAYSALDIPEGDCLLQTGSVVKTGTTLALIINFWAKKFTNIYYTFKPWSSHCNTSLQHCATLLLNIRPTICVCKPNEHIVDTT